MINYVDDTVYYANNDQGRHNFENKLFKRFHLSLLGKVKWYLGMRNTQNEDNTTLDQNQYFKNITSRFKNPSNIHSKVNNLHYQPISCHLRRTVQL